MFKKVATFTDGKGLAGVEFFKDGSMMWYAHYAKWMLLEDGRLKLDFSVLPGAGDVKKVTFEKDTMILAFSERQLEARAHPSLRASWPYAQALKLAQHNPAVIQELGEPIEAGFLVVGAVNDAGFTGNADLIISLSGPTNTATAHVVAHKSEGQWNFDNAVVTVNNTGTTIDLLTRPGRRVRHIKTSHPLPQPELPLPNP